MGIRQALKALVIIQESIAISENDRLDIPGLEIDEAKIQKAFRTVPSRDESGLPTTPCIINTWTVQNTLRSSGLLETIYDIHMQLFIDNADQDIAADIAGAFWDAINLSFDTVEGMTLNGTISHSNLTGGTPTLVGLPWGGKPYTGLDMHLQIFIKQVSNR